MWMILKDNHGTELSRGYEGRQSIYLNVLLWHSLWLLNRHHKENVKISSNKANKRSDAFLWNSCELTFTFKWSPPELHISRHFPTGQYTYKRLSERTQNITYKSERLKINSSKFTDMQLMFTKHFMCIKYNYIPASEKFIWFWIWL
jgi:hypothetical protein